VFFYSAAYQESQSAVFMLPEKMFLQLSSERSAGDVRITQLDWKNCNNTESKRLHCCCHLPNNFDSHQIFPVLHNGMRHALKIAPSIEESAPHPNPYNKWHLDQFIYSGRAHSRDQQRE